MGWSSGHKVFDAVVGPLLAGKPKAEIIKALMVALEENDWDSQGESQYFEHPIVQKVYRNLRDAERKRRQRTAPGAGQERDE